MMNITIIGCGWLGLPLAQRFVELGEDVTGTVRSEAKAIILSENGIRPIIYSGEITEELKKVLRLTELLIICFPPSGSSDYPAEVVKILDLLPAQMKVVFTSSTGVYKDIDGLVDESGECLMEHPVLRAEQVIREKCPEHYCILRLAGLFGGGRHPVNHLAGRQGIKNGKAPVNLVHRQDVIDAIVMVVQKELFGRTFNLSFPDHPTRDEYYTHMAGKLQIEEPRFEDDPSGGKKVVGDRITLESGFSYKYDLYNL